MQIVVTITEQETRAAVAEWLERHKGIKVGFDRLEPIMEKHGSHEDTEHVQNGYTVKADTLDHLTSGEMLEAKVEETPTKPGKKR